MKVLENILEKHITKMLGRTDESYVSIEDMKKQPEWDVTIEAMKEASGLNLVEIKCLESRLELLNMFKKLRDDHGYFGGYDNGQIIDREIKECVDRLKTIEDEGKVSPN
jgi:hypothetical protein